MQRTGALGIVRVDPARKTSPPAPLQKRGEPRGACWINWVLLAPTKKPRLWIESGLLLSSLAATRTSTRAALPSLRTVGKGGLLSRSLGKLIQSWRKQKGLFLSQAGWTCYLLLLVLFRRILYLVSTQHLLQRTQIWRQVRFRLPHQKYPKVPAESRSLRPLLLSGLKEVEQTYHLSTPTLLVAHSLIRKIRACHISKLVASRGRISNAVLRVPRPAVSQ